MPRKNHFRSSRAPESGSAIEQIGCDFSHQEGSETKTSTPNQIRSAAIFTAVLGGLAFFYFARVVLIPIALAAVFGMALKPMVDWLNEVKIPRILGALIVLALLLTAGGVCLVYLSRPAVSWINDAPKHVAELRQRFQTQFPPAARLWESVSTLNNFGKPEDPKQSGVSVQDKSAAGTILAWTGITLAGFFETLALLFLFLVSGDWFPRKLKAMAQNSSERNIVSTIIKDSQDNTSKYLLSISVINLALGTLLATGLHFIGMPNAMLWGMVACLLNFVPYFGPIVGVIILATAGLIGIEDFPRSILPGCCYLILHLAEANLITPYILGERFSIHPMIVFISLMFWTWLWGIPGALLAVPFLITFKIITGQVEGLKSVNELLQK